MSSFGYPIGETIKGSAILMMIIDRIALILSIIGGINWGLVGIFRFDLVAWLFGGQTAALSRVVYILVCLAALWCISLLFRHREYEDEA